MRRSDAEKLAACTHALEVARGALVDGTPDAANSVRRIAKALRETGFRRRHGPLLAQVADAAPAALSEFVDRLLGLLREETSRPSPGRLEILVIEDSPETCALLRAALEAPNRELHFVAGVAEFERIIDSIDVSLVILDLVLPDADGRDLLVRLRETPSTAGVPIVVLSGQWGLQPKSECFALGANEYIEKPFDPMLVAAAVSSQLERSMTLRREARQDLLTGLPNRVAFREAFERAKSLAGRRCAPLSIAILDVDHFKAVNDTHGHSMGDEVLRRLAMVVSSSLRRSDLLARWGGEEFIVLLPDTSEAGAALAIEDALAAMRLVKFHPASDREFSSTFSAGVAEVRSEDSVEEAVDRVDHLLYEAKAAGRNRVAASGTEVRVSRPRILVAEDEGTIAKAVGGCLEASGFDVQHVADGDAAREAALRGDASLIVLDVYLPGRDGFEVLDEVRKVPELARTPVLMFTCAGSEREISRGFDLGADDYMIKPFRPTEFLARVRRLLRRH